jgi:alcohol dehydrogenase
MNTAGGLGQYIRVPASWVIAMPDGLNAREAMSYGTAGFTSALCIGKLIKMGADPADGTVAVTGATGGVGVFAIALLAKLGFTVAAATGKPEAAAKLKALGASEIFSRQELLDMTKPLEAPRFAHAVDALGGQYLANLLKAIDYGGSVACCGLAGGADLPATVMPFILRDVNLLGVDCVQQALAVKTQTWEQLAGPWKIADIERLVEEITLDQVPEYLDRLKQGTAVGRYLVNMN